MYKKDFEGLKYFLAFSTLVICFFLYSGIVGWKWIGSTGTDKSKRDKNGNYVYRRYYHK